MSNKIKYRAWHKGKNKFLYFSGFGIDWQQGNFVMSATDNELHCYHCFGQEIDDSIQQFTGLLDKNNKEIYEGDTITYKERLDEHGDIQSLKARVIYDCKFATFGLTSLDKIHDTWNYTWNYFTDYGIGDFEVVGNIFETK